MINNLKPPLQAISGSVCDANGAVILKANREQGTTPLHPTERDELIKLVVDLLNKQFPIMKESIKESLNEAQLGDSFMDSFIKRGIICTSTPYLHK